MRFPKIDYFEAMRDEVKQYDLNFPNGPELPYNYGVLNAFRCYEDSELAESSELECNVLPALEFLGDFVKALRDANVESIAITDTGRSLLPSLAELMNLGCFLITPCTVMKQKECSYEWITVPGLRLQV